MQPGQALIELEPGDWPAQLLQANAQQVSAQAMLDKLKKGARPEELAAGARARADRAGGAAASRGRRAPRASRRPPRRGWRRKRWRCKRPSSTPRASTSSTASGAAARAELDNADMALQARRVAQRDALKNQLDELKNGSRREEVAQARAREMEQSASMKLVAAGTRDEDLRVAEAAVDAAHGRVQQIQTHDRRADDPRAARRARRGARSAAGRHLGAERDRRGAARRKTAVRAHLRARDAARPRCTSGKPCPSRSIRFRSARSAASSSTSTTSANIRRATCRPPTSAPTRCSRRASSCKKASSSCAPAWPRSSRCRSERAKSSSRSTACRARSATSTRCAT